MREIKFRAWDKDREQFHWGCSNLMLDMGGTHFWQFGMESPVPVNKDQFVLCQYTGLKDKNGKEIYEGDVLKSGRTSLFYYVSWNEEDAAWHGLCTDQEKDFHMGSYSWPENEIIGNIYENPDLINDPA